ncbi:CNGA2 [Bugula neritina]|uniref:CNGA2 n=1 Tax=Bugula neritina TaxID=10212 RepID=A0A7J7JI27_BUGNE|nr:CNGA2 [Bugula neritina]
MWVTHTMLNEETVLASLPDKLKAEIAINVHMDILSQVGIFQDCEPGLLAELVLKLRLQVFSPGDYICRKGDIGREMYIVKKGRLSVVGNDEKTVFATLGEGSVFGELSILNIAGNKTGNRRTANVMSTGYSDLFVLSKHDLWDALAEYPEAKEMLIAKGKEVLLKDNLLDQEATEEGGESVDEKMKLIEQKIDALSERFLTLSLRFDKRLTELKKKINLLEVKHRTEKEERSHFHQLTVKPELHLQPGEMSLNVPNSYDC